MRSPFRHSGDRSILLCVCQLLGVIVVILLTPGVARADGHVALGADTDSCAMCHRTHSASSGAWYRPGAGTSATQAALVVIPGSSDKSLCFSCHGVTSEGSTSDVESSFEATASRHTLAPDTSVYGPSPKQCSDCHDSHGTGKTAAGTPYPAFLRSGSANTSSAYYGEQYCAKCHTARANSLWDGLGVFVQTAHYSAIPTPTSGTGIRCSICHAPHGSSNTALVVERLVPPAVGATNTVPANDRRFCTGCHSVEYGTFVPGVYASSGHGKSTRSIPVRAEYASRTATRTIGECQVCHDPMGRDDGRGAPIPKLADAQRAVLCYECHQPSGPAGTDLRSLSYSPTSSPSGEVVAGYSPPTSTAAYGRVSVYVQDDKAAAPRPLIGPREYRSTAAVGRLAVGDVDGDSQQEVVVADPSSARLAVFHHDPLRGLSADGSGAILPIAAPANAIAIANILPLSDTQRPVIAVATGSTGGKLYLYRLSAPGVLDQLGGSIDIGDGPFSIVVGDVTGTAGPDFVIASAGSSEIRVVTASATPSVPSVGAPIRTAASPVAVAVGSLDAGPKQQIVIVENGETGKLVVMEGAGTVRGSYAIDRPGDTTATACVVGDVLPGIAGGEVCVALASTDTSGAVEVFPQAGGGGLDVGRTYPLGLRYAPAQLAVGDVDGDGRAELVVGNAGVRWPGTPRSPSVQVVRADSPGTDLSGVSTLWGGGAELAGRAPDVAVANIVDIGQSRHPSGEQASSHVSTETSPFSMHVECADCHEVHAANDSSATAPNVYGPLDGTWGVAVQNRAVGDVVLTEQRGIRYEYELCFKCHTGWSGSSVGRRDLSFDFNTHNASVHAVEPGSPAATMRSGQFTDPPAGRQAWTGSSVLYCTDCHTAPSSAAASGPHTSPFAPILSSPYFGVTPGSDQGLCYRCHPYDVYYTGSADSASNGSYFYSQTPALAKLHSEHATTHGLGCDACHLGHGSTSLAHLIRSDVGYSSNASGGSCSNDCHGTPPLRSYTR